MTDIRNCYGDRGIGPDIPILELFHRGTEAMRRVGRRHNADDECRVCRGSGYADTDGVYGRCWCCNGTGARGAATTGPYVP